MSFPGLTKYINVGLFITKDGYIFFYLTQALLVWVSDSGFWESSHLLSQLPSLLLKLRLLWDQIININRGIWYPCQQHKITDWLILIWFIWNNQLWIPYLDSPLTSDLLVSFSWTSARIPAHSSRCWGCILRFTVRIKILECQKNQFN